MGTLKIVQVLDTSWGTLDTPSHIIICYFFLNVYINTDGNIVVIK